MTEPRAEAPRQPSRPGRSWAWLVAVMVVLGLSSFVAPAAWAHDFRPALLHLSERPELPGSFELRLSVPRVSSAGPIAPGALEVRVPPHCTLARTHLDCGARGLVGELGVTGLDEHPIDVIVDLRFSDGTRLTQVLGPERPSMTLEDALAHGPNHEQRVREYFALGVEHILGGFDHLLFVFGLVLLVRGVRTLAWTITAFTAAHSLTLAAAALSLVSLPGPPVELLIALSIVVLARELAVETRAPERARESWSFRYPYAVAFGFGLLHGFGFAGALAEVGLPAEQIPLALLGFNLGVEAGQLGVVALLLAGGAGLRAVARRVEHSARAEAALRRVSIYAMGSLAFAFTLERVIALVWP